MLDVCPDCGKKHIDIAKPQYWETQTPGQCWKHSVNMLNKYGVVGGKDINSIIVASQNGKKLIQKNKSEGINYIINQLELEHPIVIGVDDDRQETYNSDNTTEHFILIVGYGCENGKQFFRYFDPGSKDVILGTNVNNKLYVEPNFIKGKSPGGSKTYTIAQIRRNSK